MSPRNPEPVTPAWVADEPGTSTPSPVPPATGRGWPSGPVVALLRILFLCGAGVGLGLAAWVDGRELVDFVARNLSSDGSLSPETARQVAALRWILLAAGTAALAGALFVHRVIAAYRALETGVLAAARLLTHILIALARWIAARAASATRTLPSSQHERALLVLLGGIVVGLAIWSHHVQPPFHSDGINLQPPANLVRYGKYATRTNLGFDLDTHRISTGPAMLLPTALVYKLFGIDLQHAHNLALAFFLAFLIATYLGLRRIYGGPTVLLGLLFFVLNPAHIFFGPSNGYISAGMGESPALFYLVCGALLWASGVNRPSELRLFLAGVFWGLAFQSKWLFLFSLPAVVVTWALLAFAGRRLPSRAYLLPAAGLLVAPAAFFVMRLSEFGLHAEVDHLGRLWQQHAGRAAGFSAGEGQTQSIFAFARPLITLAQVDFWSMLGGFLTLPAIAYAAVHLKKRPAPLALYMFTFTAIWGLWWALFSFDLPIEHLLYIWPFVQIYVAKLIVDGWTAVAAARRVPEPLAPRLLSSCLLAGIGLIVFGKTLVPLAGQVDAIVRGSRTLTPAYRQMVDYVDHHTEADAVFSGWGWSLPWWLAIETDRTIKDRSRYPADQREAGPEYLVVAPEWPLGAPNTGWPNMAYASHWTLNQNAHRREFISRDCTHLLTTGSEHQWSIYRVNPTAVPEGAAAPAAALPAETEPLSAVQAP